jgi:hypothetical protein
MTSNRIDRRLKEVSWPELEKVDSIHFQEGDVLLVCGGFEDRVMTVLNKAIETDVSALTVVDFEYYPSVEGNQHHQINKICEGVGWTHKQIQYDRCNPAGIFETVVQNIPADSKRIFVDISGMSRLLIMQLVVGALQRLELNDISILYTEAESYPPSQTEAESGLPEKGNDFSEISSFLSTGVYDLAIVPELSSINITQAPIRLVAFPSFNPAQLYSVRSIIQPPKTTLINGVPPNKELFWRKEIISKLNIIDDVTVTEESNLNASTLDYSECLSKLLTLYEDFSESNSLVISPTGSKMQTLAVGIFRSFVQDVQIVYPTPLHFTDPTDHTHGAKQVYSLSLKPFFEFRNSLQL